MSVIHFLNVKQGDCSIIQHNSGHVTIIDVCNAEEPKNLSAEALQVREIRDQLQDVLAATSGNFNEKARPVNPIEYMEERGIRSVFRYVQTHPDMDHMDGIKSFFSHFGPINFWDTNNNKEMESWEGSPYNSDDWYFYKRLRDASLASDPKRLTLHSGAKGSYWNMKPDGRNGDGIHILSPTRELVEQANEGGDDYNDCSYVLLYKTGNMKVVFSGDSHDRTWEHILANHYDSVEDIDILIAPHHGRSSDRDYGFLDVLRPSLTLFGNARSQDLAYGAWNYRGLPHITNNQANCVVIQISDDVADIYVTNERFARKQNSDTYYNEKLHAWSLWQLTPKA